jgi:hypothetical protein
MRNINKNFGPLLATAGLFCNRHNWFLCAVIPALCGQRYALGVIIGTHGRHGLLLGNRWFLNGMKARGQ